MITDKSPRFRKETVVQTGLIKRLKGKPIFISKHAISRFKQRFRDLFAPPFFYEEEKTKNLMLSQIEKSIECVAWLNKPEIVKMVWQKYGQSKVFKNGPIYYVLRESHREWALVTCLPSWHEEGY